LKNITQKNDVMKKLIVIGIFITIMVIDCYGQWIENDSNLSTLDNVSIGTNNRERTLHVYGRGMIQSYSPRLTLRRSTDNGGFIQGIQTEFENGDANFFFGNLHNSTWLVSKGNYSGKRLFTIKSDGKVGIGTTNPDHTLDVNGVIKAKEIKVEGGDGTTYNPSLSLKSNTNKAWSLISFYGGTYDRTKDYIIGRGRYNYNNGRALTIHIPSRSSFYNGTGEYPQIAFVSSGTVTLGYIQSETGNWYMKGNVGIGTTTPDHKLDVNGTIRSKEIKVETGWSDFVFEEDYNLKSLEELETYISQNKHLPDIPTEAQVKEKGINLGEMNAKLLQKIEELTLYVIEQSKRNYIQQSQIEVLKNRIVTLENKLY